MDVRYSKTLSSFFLLIVASSFLLYMISVNPFDIFRDFTPTHISWATQNVRKIMHQTSKRTQNIASKQCSSDLMHNDSNDIQKWNQMKNLSSRFKDYYINPNDEPSEKIIILTPVSNAKKHLHRYMSNLCSLTYPHSLISVVLGEDSSRDHTLSTAAELLSKVKDVFHRVAIVKMDDDHHKFEAKSGRHEASYQLKRRSHMAESRNQLLMTGLQDEAWVLWIDVDVAYIPPNLIEELLADNFLMLEGYATTKRLYLNELRHMGKVVELDGVGGCVLLIRAQLHRRGLIFPSFIFDHHIETEGLAKMASKMHEIMYGMPFLEVYHS